MIMNFFDMLVSKSINGGGGGSGTSNYNDLSNKPSINNVTLTGNKTASALGLQPEITGDVKISSDNVDDTGATNLFVTSNEKSTWSGKQDALTFDDAPTENSNNPVKSGGIYTALSGKQATLTFDDSPTSGSSNPVKSGGVYTALGNKQDTVTFDGTYSASTNKAATVSTVTNAVNALDVTGGSVAASKTLASWSETDGKVSVTTQDIAITGSQAVLTGYSIAQSKQSIAATDTATEAFGKVEQRVQTNETNILSLQGEAQTNNITLTDMNGFATGTVKTGYVDNVANITGYVTIRTYAEPNSRKMQVLEAQDGTTRTRYFNGTTWTDFENSLSAKVDGMSDVISSILVHGTQSWDTVQTIVRSGLAPQYYPVGTLLYDNMDESTGKAFRVVGYDNFFDETLTGQGYSHSMTLLEEKLNYPSIQFDAPEAWLYLSYDGQPIVSGQAYRFTIPNWDASYGGNKTYIFTATANVSKETAADAGDGGQLTLAWAYQQNPTSVSAYANNSSTTALFTANIAVWNGTDECINLGTIKLAMSDADSTYGKLNHIHRARYGSNNYYQSGMRQWLNATTASDWWQPTTIFDRAYGSRSTAGRLSTLNANMVAKIATPTITCITNNLFETGFALNTQYTVKDKIFLLTHTEVGLSDNPNIGSTLAYYVGAANSKRIKYKTDNTAQHWWLRTPYPSVAYTERHVNTSGALSGGIASNIYGAAAACIIQ